MAIQLPSGAESSNMDIIRRDTGLYVQFVHASFSVNPLRVGTQLSNIVGNNKATNGVETE